MSRQQEIALLLRSLFENLYNAHGINTVLHLLLGCIFPKNSCVCRRCEGARARGSSEPPGNLEGRGDGRPDAVLVPVSEVSLSHYPSAYFAFRVYAGFGFICSHRKDTSQHTQLGRLDGFRHRVARLKSSA